MTIKYETIRTKDHLIYRRHNRPHRMKLPAYIFNDIHTTEYSWYEYGRQHRFSEPASIYMSNHSYYHRGWWVANPPIL